MVAKFHFMCTLRHDLTLNSYINCLAGETEQAVSRLTNAVTVCSQPQQLLQVFHSTLPEHVFQMLIEKLSSMAPVSMQQQVSVKYKLNSLTLVKTIL